MFRFLPFILFASAAWAAEPFSWKALAPLPDALGVAGPFAGISGGALLAAGGANFPDKMPWDGGRKEWTDRVWILETPDGAWRDAGRLPRALGYGVSVTHRDALVCVGGSDADRHFAETFRLMWQDGALKIQPLPALPIALAGASGALVGDVLIVAGGSESPEEKAASNRVFALDLAERSPTWRELPPLPGAPRLLATAASDSRIFYLFGGAALAPDASGKIVRTYLREAWSFRADQGWKRLADLPKPAVAAPSPAPLVNGKLLLVAGDDGSRVGFTPAEKHPGFPKTILAYEPAHDRWSEAGETPAPRATVPCVEWRGHFVMPSGEMRPGVRSPEVWSLLPQ